MSDKTQTASEDSAKEPREPAEALSHTDLEQVSGGFNPQPDPPGKPIVKPA